MIRPSLARVTCFAVLLGWFAPPAQGFQGGVTTGSFGVGGCNDCHSGGTAPVVNLSGPTSVAPGSTHTYTLTVTNPMLQTHAGLNVSATAGVLAEGGPDSAQTHVVSSQITHSSPKAGVSGTTTFSFEWTAPLSFSSAQIRAWGNAVNLNMLPGGDRAASHFVNVAAMPPTATPTASPTPSPTSPPALCAATPRVCDPAPKSSLVMMNHPTDDKKDAVSFKWSKGATTNLGDFGDPMFTTHYALCLYQDGVYHAELSAPAADTCNGKPCWVSNGKVIRYKDKLATPNGITAIGLASGKVPGKAKIQLKAKGVNLPDPASISPGVSVTAQLVQSATSNCWGATWTPAEISTDGVKLKAKSSN